MKKLFPYTLKRLLAVTTILVVITSCNKDVPEPVAIAFPEPTGPSIASIISSDPNYSILKAAVERAGLMSLLADSTKSFTLFAPDNAAFIASGIPNESVIGLLRPGLLDTVLRYHLVPGKVKAAQIPNTF